MFCFTIPYGFCFGGRLMGPTADFCPRGIFMVNVCGIFLSFFFLIQVVVRMFFYNFHDFF